jgi:hypothetical protein
MMRLLDTNICKSQLNEIKLYFGLKKPDVLKGKQIMPHSIYSNLISEIKALKLSDQLRLLEETAILIRRKAGEGRPRSILELKGKGKDIWKDVEVQKYIDGERSSWNG